MSYSETAAWVACLLTLIGWIIVGKQNHKSIERTETWELLKDVIAQIEATTKQSFSFYSERKVDEVFILNESIDNIGLKLDLLSVSEVTFTTYVSYKKSITDHRFFSTSHKVAQLSLSSTDKQKLLSDISVANDKLIFQLHSEFQSFYSARRLKFRKELFFFPFFPRK